jgi:hypothetical protein
MIRTYLTYLVSDVLELSRAGEFTLWKGNRHIDENVVAHIVRDVNASHNYGPSPIILGMLDGKGYVVDGQHRLAAAALLEPAARNVHLTICRVPVADEAALKILFRIVNCGTPVPMSHWNDEIATFVRNLTAAINNQWPGVISLRSRAHRPRTCEAALRCAVDENRHIRTAATAGVLCVDDAMRELIAMNAVDMATLNSAHGPEFLTNYDMPASLISHIHSLQFAVGARLHWEKFFIAKMCEIWSAI